MATPEEETPPQIKLVNELEQRIWARDPQLAAACQDLFIEIRRRWLCGIDWHKHYLACLNDIPEIRSMPGSGINNCWFPEEIRNVVLTLVKRCQVTWEKDSAGEPKPPAK